MDGVEELEGLPSLQQYCRKALKLKLEYDQIREMFEEKEKEYKKFFQKEFPSVMNELSLSECVLEDGTKIKVKQKASLSLTGKRKDEVFEFIRKNEGQMLLSEVLLVDPVYKTELQVPFETQTTANTNSVKAFLLSGIREGRFELPNDFPMYVWTECEVS